MLDFTAYSKPQRDKMDKMVKYECCMNPWNGECGNTDIEVYVLFRGDKFPICRSCWSKIAESEIEWSYEDTPSKWVSEE